MDWRLYLLRHGIAEEGYAPGVSSDFERQLTDKGRVRVRQMADAFARTEPNLGLIVSSPLVRARQTAEIVAEVLGMDEIQIDDRLQPMSDPREVRDILIERQRDGENVLLVGHLPHMSLTISWALGRAVAAEMKKASLACLRFPGYTRQPPAELEFLVPPRWVRSLVSENDA